MKNTQHLGEITHEDITVVTDADNSKVVQRVERARALRADLDAAIFDAADIDAFKRNGRRFDSE